MKFQFFVMVFTAAATSIMGCENDLFSRIYRILPSNVDPVISNTEIRSRGMCAMISKVEDVCLSFSYTETDRRCDTYTKALVEEENADVSNFTMYFTKDIVPCNNQEVSQTAHAESTTVDIAEGIDVPWTCDINSSSSWIVIQKRTSGDLDFTRSWADYKSGFSNSEGDCWIVDAMTPHNNTDFSTFDRDNDKSPGTHCSELFLGGWWYDDCFYSNLNGQYMVDDGNQRPKAINWNEFPNDRFRPLKGSKMMLR